MPQPAGADRERRPADRLAAEKSGVVPVGGRAAARIGFVMEDT